jgi:AcrR family transcriptional regulator
MPRSAAENERIRASQRTAILAAARAVFARRGLAATIDEVAVAAGVSHGLAYRYFASKAELFRALAQEALTRSADGPDAPVVTGTPGERLSRVIRVLVDNRRDHPETFQLLQHVLTDPSAPGTC